MTRRRAALLASRRWALSLIISVVTFSAAPVLSRVAAARAVDADAASAPAAGCVASSGAPPQFLIGVWQQPNDSFAKWRSRGVNTIVDDLWLQTSDSFSTWEQDLACQDLYAIRPPEQPLNQENADPRLLALAQQDEPDSAGTPASVVQSLYAQWKAGAPAKPVFVNFSSANIYEHLGDLPSLQAEFSGWIAGADWISEDIYPVSGYNRPDWIDLSETADPPTGFVEDLLQQWSSGKPQFAFIEASNQSGAATYRAPTADEFRGEVWDAIIHGARGIFYYPQAPNVDDAVPPDLVAEMTNLDAQLARLGPLLAAPGSRLNLRPPLEAATRTYCGVTYTITLNFSHGSASGNGSTFAPYEAQVSPTPPDPLPSCSADSLAPGLPATPGMTALATSAGSSGLAAAAATKPRAAKRCPAPKRRDRLSATRRTKCAPARPVKCTRARRCATCKALRSSRACKAPKRKSSK